ncbi:NusA antitermination factor [Pilibacter termitis]|uniref:Transcription termination/antitermination protein NusA n=1 Tax=Pilibacter termitis TaxID=263852 RepID=A0A1T4KNU4_9ENTE|nr:transcription termination factor NusA [Pilibacter termitis]SJZ44085.1 NusA antitermination factor [Pilibacter termitis]
MSKEMLRALDAIEEEKGVKKELVIEALEKALVAAYKRYYGQAQNVQVAFNEKKGDFKVYQVKEVVDMVFDSQLEMSLEQAHELNPHYEVGDKIKLEQTPKDFGRIAAQTAKQVIVQTVREEERAIIYNEYSQYENDVMTGTVERMDNRFIYVNLGKIEAVMTKKDQIPTEVYHPHDRIKVFVYKVNKTTKGPQINVSRTHPDLLRRLFEAEVPEIYDGTVEIVSIAREAGDRAKVSVRSHDENVDPIGTVVGPRGSRVQAIVNELSGENMDIAAYSDDPFVYISNALNPAEVIDIFFEPDNNRVATAFVADHQLSLAIGKRGQNVRLAARLTGYKIDIKKESDMDDFLVGYDERVAAYDAKKATEELFAEETTDETVYEEVAADDVVETE